MEDENNFENQKHIKENQDESAHTKNADGQKDDLDFIRYFEEGYVKSQKKLRFLKNAKSALRLTTIIACFISAALFAGAIVDKNISRSEFKMSQEYAEIVKSESEALLHDYENGQISTHEYIKKTKALSSNKFVDKKIKTSDENPEIKQTYKNHTAKIIAGASSVLSGIGLGLAQAGLDKKIDKAEDEESYYKQFFI